MLQPKRIRYKGRIEFLKYYNIRLIYSEINYVFGIKDKNKVKFYKSFLINQQWANDFFRDKNKECFCINMNESLFQVECNREIWPPNFFTLDLMLVVIRLVDLDAVKLGFDYFDLDRVDLLQYISFCRGFKDSKTLKTIDIFTGKTTANHTTQSINIILQTLADLLPKDKIRKLNCQSNVAICFKEHSIEELVINDLEEDHWKLFDQVDKLELLRLKAKTIRFEKCSKDLKFSDFFDIFKGRMISNPIVEELHIPLRFILCCQEYYEKEENNWVQEHLPKFENLFKQLAIFHPHLKLTILADGGNMYNAGAYGNNVEDLFECASWCLQQIIDCSLNFNIEVKEIQLQWSTCFTMFHTSFQTSQNKRIEFEVKQNSYLKQREEYKDIELTCKMKCIYFNDRKDNEKLDLLFRSRKNLLNYKY